MANVKRTPWAYLSRKTALHRWSALIKLLLLLAFTALAVWGGIPSACAFAVILTGSLFAGMGLFALFAGSRPLVIMLVFLAVFRGIGINTETAGNLFSIFTMDIAALKSGLIFSAGILVCFSAASLFFAVTTTGEIRASLASVELFFVRPFLKKDKNGNLERKQGRLSLAFALMLGFLPRFFEYWEMSSLAVRARGCTGKVRAIMAALPLVTERMIEAAAETAQALESRGLNVS
jgi:energy-coupling factor transporter transmembrane protein EcfT